MSSSCAAPSRLSPTPGAGRTRVARRPQTILLVDDDEGFRSEIVRALRRRGHRVLHCASGEAATAVAQTETVDVIVVDGLLPDIDGISWITTFRRHDARTRIVFVSAFWGFVETLHGLAQRLEVELVVHKPVDPEAFCDQLELQQGQGSEERPVQLGPVTDDRELMSRRKAEYAHALPGKLHALADALRRARTAPASPASSEARLLAHNLRGTAGWYGFGHVGDSMAVIEDALMAPERTSQAWAKIDQELERASRSAESAISEPPSGRNAVGVGGARILAVTGDDDFAAQLEQIGSGELHEVVRARSAADALRDARILPPDVVVIQLEAGAVATGLATARDLREIPGLSTVPVAFVASECGIADRILAAREPGSLFLAEPLEPEILGAALRQLVDRGRAPPARVLVVGGPGALVASLAPVLAGAGMHVATLEQPERTLAALAELRPDLCLVEAGPGGAEGLDVCRVLRATLEWQDVPIVVAWPGADATGRVAAFEAGADDCLTEPLEDDELLARTRGHVSRARLVRDKFEKDALTGLLLRGAFRERLARSLASSHRHDHPLTVCLLDVDLFKSINDEHGHLAGDAALAALGRLLSARFRAEDLRARWGGEEFVLAFPGETAEIIHRVLTRVLREFGEHEFRGERADPFHVTFSAGVASFPNDGVTVQALLGAADRRLYDAKRAGRARVVSVG